eukprot:2527485-Rhodomonas_salina.2
MPGQQSAVRQPVPPPAGLVPSLGLVVGLKVEAVLADAVRAAQQACSIALAILLLALAPAAAAAAHRLQRSAGRENLARIELEFCSLEGL